MKTVKNKTPHELQIDRQILIAYGKGKITGDLKTLLNDFKLRQEIEDKMKGRK